MEDGTGDQATQPAPQPGLMAVTESVTRGQAARAPSAMATRYSEAARPSARLAKARTSRAHRAGLM